MAGSETPVVAVTGAAGALGSTTVEVLAQAGWTVVAIARSAPPATAAALTIAGVDLTDEAAMQSVADRIARQLGRLDGLANIAGGFRWEKIAGGELATWDHLYARNVKTALVATRALLPLLRRSRGAIVNVGAAGAARAGTGMGAYAAAKAGVARLTEALADELKEEGARANAVLPSIIDTPANRAAMPDAPVDRWVTTEQLAAVIAFLLSPAAAAVTGALVPVTGRL